MSARFFRLLPVLAVAINASAGGGPQNTLIVINDQSIESQEVGLHYRLMRGIPERNICRVSVPPASAHPSFHNMSFVEFQTSVVERIYLHMADQGIANQIDCVVLCPDLPTRVNDNEGSTAVLFYGFKNAPLIGQCSMPTNTQSHYYAAERALNRADEYGGTNYLITFSLSANRMASVLSNINRSVAADGTAPTGTFYFIQGADPARNVRYKLYDNFDFNTRFFSDFPRFVYDTWGPLRNASDILGCQVGSSQANDYWQSVTNNTYLPGSISDHLTSYAGRLPIPPINQSSVWDWLSYGSSASYGTVNEPCNYLEKFPDPMVYFWYARGFSLGESYLMSVKNPYQGLFVGDPLTAPYAAPPPVAITNLVAGQIVTGVVGVGLAATTNAAGIPPNNLDVYLDDLFLSNATNIPPTPGNIVRLLIESNEVSHQVQSGETMYDVVSAMAGNVNASNLPVTAAARGDRLELIYTNWGFAGTGISYSVTTEAGSAAELTVWAEALTQNLIESAYPAREYIRLQAYGGKANAGDEVTCVLTLTNGIAITNRVVTLQDEAPTQTMARLMAAINSHPDLQGQDGVYANPHTYGPVSFLPLEARTPGPDGYNLHVDYTITPATPGSGLFPGDSFSDNFNDNLSDLTARGNVLFRSGRGVLEANASLDTTSLPNGTHVLRAVAKLGSGPETQGHFTIPVVVSNSPLACSILAPTNAQSFSLGDNVFTHAKVTNAVSVTQIVFLVEGKSHTVLTNAPFVTAWNTMDFGVGHISVRAAAYDASGSAALSDPVEVRITRSPILDTDGDDLPDSWEQQHFGGLFAYDGTDDPDGDEYNNYEEYVAATAPSDAFSFFSIALSIDESNHPALFLLTATNRLYQVQYIDDLLSEDWLIASPAPFPGSGATNWLDDGSETEPDPDNASRRMYRVKVTLPD